MAKDPAARPASAGELAADLERALAGVRADAEPAPPPTAPLSPAATVERRGVTTQPSRRERRAWLAPVALAAALVALLVGGAVLLSSGDGSDDGDGGAQQEGAGRSESGGRGSGGSGGEPGEGRENPPPTGADTPEGTVQTFYTRAAGDDFEGAWELASPAFQSQLGGYDAFVGQQSSLQAIEFEKVKVKGSGEAPEVEIETVATHSDRVETCKGSLHLVRGGAAWLIDRAENVQCARQ
jgi:hypothetical protein